MYTIDTELSGTLTSRTLMQVAEIKDRDGHPLGVFSPAFENPVI